jgi:hypothetical protein
VYLGPAVNRASPNHFRAYERRPVRLAVALGGARSGERAATVVDISLAGAGLEVEELLAPGERITLAFQTPTLWDPLVITAVVTWSAPPRPREPGSFGVGRQRPMARAGVAFDYPAPDIIFAMFEMLATLDYE